tara:strand:+ start:173 stop:3877 length:3705 start_codon:yes stop_codon:yes gene_type:complete
MPKKACCCNKCSWCDRDHWYRNPFNSSDPFANEGILEQPAQQNWMVTGTITTELPSIGHPMTGLNYINCDPCPSGGQEVQSCCDIGLPLDVALYEIIDPKNPNAGYTSSFRTPSNVLNIPSFGWGDAAFYGDISPCWFNGINMTNVDLFSGTPGCSGTSGPGPSGPTGCCGPSGLSGSTGCCGAADGCCGTSGYTGSDACCQPTYYNNNHFFNFTFELQIEKYNSVGNTYSKIIDIKRTGPARNVRPHPDACHSFNVNEGAPWKELSNCDVFFDNIDGDGNPAICTRDFARMPRGPWPYRFKKWIDVDKNCPDCWESHTVFDGIKFTKQQVEEALADPTSYPDTPWIRDCPLIQSPCSGFGVFPSIDNCCSSPFLDNDQLCNQLDPDNGTPFGWEDIPEGCKAYSNSNPNFVGSLPFDGSTANMHFFGWMNPFNRYTTPEWDLYDGPSGSTDTMICGCNGTGYTCSPSGFCGACGACGPHGYTLGILSKKVSLNVIVPTQYHVIETGNPFCSPDPFAQGLGFGEWCFGMDYEATDEIQSLELAGYQWSNGRESDGIWINQTPTSALRVLFTLDHSDIAPGKVWRVFRDWDVTVCNRIKIFNPGTPQETKFRVSLKQKVEEVQFSSLGCDCPSGITVNEDGKLVSIEDACDDHVIFGEYEESPFASCWESNIDGPNSSNIGGRVSFSERGPIIIRAILETDETGCSNCSGPHDQEFTNCAEKFGSRTHPLDNINPKGGQLMIVNGYSVACPIDCPIEFPKWGLWPTAPVQTCITRCWTDLGLGCSPSLIYDDNGGKIIKPPPSVYAIFKEHGARFDDAIADVPCAAGHKGYVGILRYRSSYMPIYQSTSAIETELVAQYQDGSNVYGTYTHQYEEYRCISGNICGQESSTPKDIFQNARIFVDKWPTRAIVGNCTIQCPCGASSTTEEPDQPEPGQPCWDGSFPTPGHPCVGVGNGGYCAGAGGFEQCPCNKDNPNAANIGPLLFPSYGCNTNLSRINGYGASDFNYTCFPAIPQGVYEPTCTDNINIPHRFGLDSERFYFTAYGQVNAYTGLGELGCAARCSCPASDPPTGCYNEDGSCKFCAGAGSEIGFGFPRNMMINWKKYLCHQRSVDGYKIPPDIMGKFEWGCGAKDGITGSTTANGCDVAWSVGDCVQANVPINSLSTTIDRLKEVSDLDPNYHLKFEKYNIQFDDVFDQINRDTELCPWDTTYEPNSARSGLTYGRNHIIIKAQGPY